MNINPPLRTAPARIRQQPDGYVVELVGVKKADSGEFVHTKPNPSLPLALAEAELLAREVGYLLV